MVQGGKTIDQTGNEVAATSVDDACAVRNVHRICRTHRNDPVPTHHNDRIRYICPGGAIVADVDDCNIADHYHFSRRGNGHWRPCDHQYKQCRTQDKQGLHVVSSVGGGWVKDNRKADSRPTANVLSTAKISKYQLPFIAKYG